MRSWRMTTLGVVVAAALAAAFAVGASPQEPQAKPKKQAAKPNIVFVLVDDMSRNLLGYMPHVRSMQRRGATFSNYFVTDSLCCPSRASIFTGRFPHNTGIFTNLPPDGGWQLFHDNGQERDTFATSLRQAGFRTAMMGKYMNGYKARSAVPPGWDEWAVADNGYPEYDYELNVNGTIEPHGNAPQDYLTDVVAGKGADFISRQAKAGKPFMLEIATFAPHAPYTPAPQDMNKFPGARAPRGPAFNAQNTNPPAWLGQRAPLKPKAIARLDASFRRRAQSLQAVDRMLAGLEATLRRAGVARNTDVVFSSDNGYHMGQRRLMAGKQTAFDHDIHVPMVVVGPGVRGGRTIGTIAQNTDLRPTFGELGGAKVPADVDGRSLVRLLHGRKAPKDWRSGALIEHHKTPPSALDPDRAARQAGVPPNYAALRTKQALYVEYETGEREYYRLRDDPLELVNRIGGVSPARQRALHAQLARLQACKGKAACRKAGR